MKAKETLQPTGLIFATVLLMFLSVSSMVAVGLASGFQSPPPFRAGSQAVSGPVRSEQGVQMHALRGRIARWAAYFARSG